MPHTDLCLHIPDEIGPREYVYTACCDVWTLLTRMDRSLPCEWYVHDTDHVSRVSPLQASVKPAEVVKNAGQSILGFARRFVGKDDSVQHGSGHDLRVSDSSNGASQKVCITHNVASCVK